MVENVANLRIAVRRILMYLFLCSYFTYEAKSSVGQKLTLCFNNKKPDVHIILKKYIGFLKISILQ
jgi:hypothetical protein